MDDLLSCSTETDIVITVSLACGTVVKRRRRRNKNEPKGWLAAAQGPVFTELVTATRGTLTRSG
jgi:hypothetical protein